MAAPAAGAWGDSAAGIGMVPAVGELFASEAAGFSVPDGSAGAWGALAVNALGPTVLGWAAPSRSANACEGPEAGSSFVGGWPMCTVPGTRKAVVVSAFTSAGEPDASGASSSDAGGDAGAPP
ncbi:hypothetical protein ACFYUV_21225 [Nonomuraea sp. NPDC003560]|uniref:hypothetical protein n=1 Tax=Nonomuraea sp. NPDC003560 TaxID=3364341 RepID=UPI0036B57B53